MKYSRTDMGNAKIEVGLPSTNDFSFREPVAKEKAEWRPRKRIKKKRAARSYKNRVPTQYKVYIKSEWWRKRKSAYYKTHRKRCSVCESASFVDLHHVVYGNYGNERDEDLVPLCKNHHITFHAKVGVKGNMSAETAEYVYSQAFDEQAENVMRAL